MKQASPFHKIVVAYDDSPAARDALRAGIELCKLVDKPLETITVMEPPPAYSGFIVAVAPDVARGLEMDRRQHHEKIVEFAVAEGRRHDIAVTGHVVEAAEVDGVISFLRQREADLLRHRTPTPQLACSPTVEHGSEFGARGTMQCPSHSRIFRRG